jgi:hypothetical protein
LVRNGHRGRAARGRGAGLSTADEDALDVAHALEEHVPYTAAELGLDLGIPRRRLPSRAVIAALAAVAAVLVIAGVWAVTGADDATEVGDLSPGDCYDPVRPVLGGAVQRRACDEPHEGELIALVNVLRDQSTYPGPQQVALQAEAACSSRAEDLSEQSEAALARDDLAIAATVPSEAAWESGDRATACSFVAADGRPLTSKVAAGP